MVNTLGIIIIPVFESVKYMKGPPHVVAFMLAFRDPEVFHLNQTIKI